MNHLLAGLAELTEMWESSISVMYRNKMEAVVMLLLSFPLHLLPLVHPIFTYTSLYVAKQHFETAHTKVTIYYNTIPFLHRPKIPLL